MHGARRADSQGCVDTNRQGPLQETHILGRQRRANLVANVNVLAGAGRFHDRIADDGIAIAVDEGCAIGSDLIVVHDGVKEMMEFVHEAVFPADDMAMRPPILPVGMMRFGHQHIVETLRGVRLFALPVDVEFVQPLEIELNRAIFGIDLEGIEILASLPESRRLDCAKGAVLKVQQRDETIVDIRLDHAA